ncbi:MAG: DoxX family protein [Candidatus Pacebacteria bacterium]|nr:DoxX family protein [Candidatus Paceibacterota bacterium]
MQEPNENWKLSEIGGWKGFVKQLYRHHKPSGGALILRIALGVLFVYEGWTKLSGISGTEHFFAMLGLASHFWVYLVAYTELVGGILILVGFLTKPVCVALAIDMAVVVWGVPAHGGFDWGHPYEFFLLLTLLSLYIGGPGKYSLAHLWHRRKH